MLDFFKIATRSPRQGIMEIYPKFLVGNKSDVMIRGGDFYAVWVEERGLWSTNEQDVIDLIDRELARYAEENRDKFTGYSIHILWMWDSDSGSVDRWHKYCQKQQRDNYHMLDEQLIFSNHETCKEDYASKRLNYPLEPCDIPAYDKLMSTLYEEEERRKLEWAVGAIITGESKSIQKFLVLYGAAGTGKSTFLNIVQQLFEGYYSVFDAKALGSANASFALEAFASNPLVAIQHDGDLSKIEDNTRLNSLVSHELMTVNEKFKRAYANRFKCFLFMGTNKPVKITDGKSGLIRRLIDVSPSGNKVNPREYKTLIKQVNFELGGIACHCRDVYLDDPGRYDDYIPTLMMGASNDFYNFVIDAFSVFKKDDGTTLKAAWEMYKTYCDEAKVPFPYSQRNFKEELKNYFWEFEEKIEMKDGTLLRNSYSGFRIDRFDMGRKKPEGKREKTKTKENLIEFQEGISSIFDVECSDCLAQYASSTEKPREKWDSVKTTLSDLDTTKLHYVKVPENHIVIDFDIKDDDGNKSFERNLAEASKWPATYAELSKSGAGIHLHYIYTGDASKLSRIYADAIEIKVFTGNSSLRRMLTKCNNLPIATISSGLPVKGDKKVVNFDTIKSEKGLRTMIQRNLNKEIHPGTKPSIDFIHKILEDAYESGLKYDVSDMFDDILVFAANSTNQSDYCIKLVNKMQFKSEEPSDNIEDEAPIAFYDVEVFPNLFLVNWKLAGEHNKVVRMINPTSADIEQLMRFRLIGFNCRRYDNHILYARLMGYTNEELYNLSQKIITGAPNCFFSEAYNVSYTDVYDFAATKQSLKKWEIELGIHHQELGLPWDEPVPEELWVKVAEYCDNDVIATEAVFDHLHADFLARQVLADVAGMTVNDTTNSLTTRIIFGKNRKPQDQFNYRFMGTEEPPWEMKDDDYTVFDDQGRPLFPGYKFEYGKSTYRNVEVGEGGYVYSEPGMYGNVALLDIASMHPSSVVAEELFGSEYTKRFQEILDARIAIKHKDFDKARQMLGGTLAKYLNDPSDAKNLAQALKIAINSVYGLTSAKFENPFKDPRNIDNIVAKRGALFMINLRNRVQRLGFTVAHVKTDSIKIPDATPEIIQYVMEYGKQYGYTFEHEATYDRMCLVNDAVYIAKYATAEKCEELYGYAPGDNRDHPGEWTATGTQFAVPYVFKKLFSGEPIEFEDMCETKSVSSTLYLDMNEHLPDVSEWERLAGIRYKYDNGGQLTKAEDRIRTDNIDISDEELERLMAEGHDYQFIGRVGSFCPIKPGFGGGELMREKDGKYYAATGTKGYRWLEAEMVKTLGKESDIDRSYYDSLVDDAVSSLVAYGDFEWFVSDDPYIPPEYVPGDEMCHPRHEDYVNY